MGAMQYVNKNAAWCPANPHSHVRGLSTSSKKDTFFPHSIPTLSSTFQTFEAPSYLDNACRSSPSMASWVKVKVRDIVSLSLVAKEEKRGDRLGIFTICYDLILFKFQLSSSALERMGDMLANIIR